MLQPFPLHNTAVPMASLQFCMADGDPGPVTGAGAWGGPPGFPFSPLSPTQPAGGLCGCRSTDLSVKASLGVRASLPPVFTHPGTPSRGTGPPDARPHFGPGVSPPPPQSHSPMTQPAAGAPLARPSAFALIWPGRLQAGSPPRPSPRRPVSLTSSF